MSLRIARWLNAIGKPADSLRGAQRAWVKLDDDTRVRAWVKAIPAEEMVVEIASALLGAQLGLPVPEPALVQMPGADEPLHFGSIDAGEATFAHYLQHDPAVIRHLAAWTDLVPAACFDDWIANPDRHLGNILHDGREAFWLIDHGYAQVGRCAPGAVVGRNILAEVARNGKTDAVLAATTIPAARGVMQRYRHAPLDALAADRLAATFAHWATTVACLRARQPHLASMVATRLPVAQQELFDGYSP